MIGFYAAGAMGGSAPVVPVVSFVAASGTTYAVDTSQNQTIPVAAQVGDLLLAWVMHRDTLTPPSGWTLVRTEGVNNGYIHSLSLYKRVCQVGDPGASTAWSQASSVRLAIHIQAYRGNTGTPDVIDDNGTTRTTATYDNTSTTATADNQIGVVGISTVGATASTVSMSGYTLTTPASVADNRLGVAYRSRNNAETTGGTWSVSGSGANGQYHAQVSVMLGIP